MEHIRKQVLGYGAQRLADDLGISVQAVYKWLRVGRIPAERVLDIETYVGTPREALRPDLYRRATPPRSRARA